MKKPSHTRVALAALLLILFALIGLRFITDPRIPHSLTFERVEPSLPYLRFYQTFDVHDLTDALLYEPTKITGRLFPPLGYMLLGAVFALVGVGHPAVLLFNLICMAASVLLLFRIGGKIGFSTAGVLGATLFVCFSIVAFFVHEFTLEITVTPFLLLAACLLMNDGVFTRWKPTIAAGLAIGIGTMVRHDVAGHLAFPSAYLLVQAIRQTRLPQPATGIRNWISKVLLFVRKHGLVVLGFAFLSLGPFFLWFVSVRSGGVFASSFANDATYLVGHSIYNLAALFLVNIGPLLAPFVLIGLYKYFRAGSPYPYRGFLHTMLIVILVLMVIAKKSADPQQWIPVLPFIALLAAMGLEKIRSKSWRRAFIGGAILFGGLTLVLTTQSYWTLRIMNKAAESTIRRAGTESNLSVFLQVINEAMIKVNLQMPSRNEHVVGKVIRDMFQTPGGDANDEEAILIDHDLLKAGHFSHLYLNTAHFPYYAWREDPDRAIRLRLKIGISVGEIESPGEQYILFGSHTKGYEKTMGRLDAAESPFRLLGTYPVRMPRMNLANPEAMLQDVHRLGTAIRVAGEYYRQQPPVIWTNVTMYLYARNPEPH